MCELMTELSLPSGDSREEFVFKTLLDLHHVEGSGLQTTKMAARGVK